MNTTFLKSMMVMLLLAFIMPVDAALAGNTYTAQPATVTWPFNDAQQIGAYVAAPEDGFSVVAVNIGGATVKGTEAAKSLDCAADGVTFVKIQPQNGASDVVEWNVKPAKGLTFTPVRVKAYIARFGTDAENGVSVSARKANGELVALGTFTAQRNGKNHIAGDKNADKYLTSVDRFDITLTPEQQQALASTDGFSLLASIGVGNAKQGGFSNVVIEGTLDGTVADVNKYTLSAVAAPAEAGSVALNPVAESYDEGTVVNVSTTKNFGYEFVNWTDAQGNVVSTEPRFDYTVNANTVLTANYNALKTFELVYSVEGGANPYQVQPSPAPTVVDGKNLYEEGTNVTLTAISNKIVTFTNWSDGQSSSEISFKMDADKNYVASFSTIDYVAAWDFFLPGGDGRPADFASAGNDASALVLRNATGATSGWLDKSELGAGGYEGRPGAVNWRTTGLGDYYWQTMVDASAFTDIKLITAMLYNYNAYTKQDVEYSLDGEKWTKIGTIAIEGRKAWTDAEFALPADANNQPRVFIRIISDKTSPVDGTTSSNDGIAIGATYIIGNEKLVNDGVAPVLVSVVPENNSNTASINGRIVLTFDEKVKVKEGTVATLAGLDLEPEVSGKTVMFRYKNLSYGTEYTFSLAANTVSDLTDNFLDKPVNITFTTKTRPAVEKAMYDFIVPDDGSFVDAIAAAAKRTDTSVRYRVFVRNGSYKLPASTTAVKDGSDGKTYPDPTTYLSTPNVSFIGESIDGVVITNTLPAVYKENGNVLEGIGKGDVLRIEKTATATYWQNLTLKSSMGDAKGRDIVINDNSNKTVMKDVCLWGYQDTYVSNSDKGRFYFEGGILRGRTDFLCGKGDVFYNGVTLQMCQDGGYIAVPSVPKQYGYIFRDCEIVGEKSGIDGKFTLGRPWGSGTPIALFIDTKMTVKPSAAGWNEMSNGWPARFAEYNSTTANGTVIDLAGRKKTFGDGHTNNPVLTKAEADAMTIATVMGAGDDWDPTVLAEQAPAPTNVEIDGTSLTWDASDYALLWAVVKNGKVVAFTTEPAYTVDDPNASYAVRAANEMGGLGEQVVAVPAGSQVGVGSIYGDVEIIATRYFNLEGMAVSADFQGWVVRVDTLSDGSTVATKIMNK